MMALSIQQDAFLRAGNTITFARRQDRDLCAAFLRCKKLRAVRVPPQHRQRIQGPVRGAYDADKAAELQAYNKA